MKDIEAIHADLIRQLDRRRGQSGRPLGNIVLPRAQAEILAQWIELRMQMEGDNVEGSERG